MDARAKRTVSNEQAELLRQIPSVDELLLQPRLVALSSRVDRNLVVEVARAILSGLRARIAGDSKGTALAANLESVEELVAAEVERILSRSLQPVINATGVILHTNLGGCRRVSPHGHTVFESGIRFGSRCARQARCAYR
jgi:L-seryl-tRNA(Ser) seleniumtransferase